MVAPTIPAIPNWLPTLIAGLAKVKSVPIIPETREPTDPTPLDCKIVAIPATKIEADTIIEVSSTDNPKALATTSGTAMMPAKGAKIC